VEETMNQQPIELARDADMRLSMAAVKRAAYRAREIAVQTGTRLVFSHGGVVETLAPDQLRPIITLEHCPKQTTGESGKLPC
jgi:hypothetical protein